MQTLHNFVPALNVPIFVYALILYENLLLLLLLLLLDMPLLGEVLRLVLSLSLNLPSYIHAKLSVLLITLVVRILIIFISEVHI